MNKQKADSIITEYLQKIYGFALKKSFSYEEAEDLCADIVQEVYIPGGNRELLEAAAIFYGIANKCRVAIQKDYSKYYIKTTAGGDFIAYVDLPQVQADPDYKATLSYHLIGPAVI